MYIIDQAPLVAVVDRNRSNGRIEPFKQRDIAVAAERFWPEFSTVFGVGCRRITHKPICHSRNSAEDWVGVKDDTEVRRPISKVLTSTATGHGRAMRQNPGRPRREERLRKSAQRFIVGAERESRGPGIRRGMPHPREAASGCKISKTGVMWRVQKKRMREPPLGRSRAAPEDPGVARGEIGMHMGAPVAEAAWAVNRCRSNKEAEVAVKRDVAACETEAR